MASPIVFYLYPQCGLKIELNDEIQEHTDDIHVNDLRIKRKFSVTNPHELPLVETSSQENMDFGGFLSPTWSLTLPKKLKELAGIPKEARYYAFMHPPTGLANMINWEKYPFTDDLSSDSIDNKGVASASLLGGYVYFDGDFNVLCVNAISTEQNDNQSSQLKLSGPYEVDTIICDEVEHLKRPQHLTLGIFHEAGFIASAWVRPNETFQAKAIERNHHGAFLFFRDNGTAISYSIDHSGHIDPCGEVEMVSDVLQACSKMIKSKSSELRTIQIPFYPQSISDKMKIWRGTQSEKINMDFIRNGGQDFLNQDQLGWTPLHYLCRFCPNNIELIRSVIKKCPDAVVKADRYGRYPLHIACDSNCSEEVIAELVNRAPLTVFQKTKSLDALPMHMACIRRKSETTIKILLEVDQSARIVRTETVTGRLPLHLAVAMKQSPNTIGLLLDKDSSLNDDELDIYHPYNGKLPLHIACWNDSKAETVQLLLNKDKSCQTIDTVVDKKDWASERGLSKSQDQEQCGTLALHLAMKHGTADVIRHLLQKEKSRQTGQNVIGLMNTVLFRDESGQFPLHIACANNVNPSIVQMLLKLDPTRETLQNFDRNDQKFSPIHSLCENKDAKADTLKLLLDAEQYCVDKVKKFKRATSTVDVRKRSPLYLAVRANAGDILETLLHPDNFYLKGFNGAATNALAKVINKNRGLQEHVIQKLSERTFFTVLCVEFYANAFALAFFLDGSERLLRGTVSYTHPIVISACVGIFIIRELAQIKSQYAQYISDVWSWLENACIVLLSLTAKHMFEEIGNKEPIVKRNLLIATGAFLIVQCTSFLRSTFLPFARFVGGLLLIFNTLIPFFIVSLLLLLAFAYAFRVWGQADCHSLGRCYYAVLQGFFSGTDETSNAIDVLFGFVAIIILLNVVIAIVDEAWGSAAEHATQLYWDFRLDFLSGVRYFSVLTEKVCPGGLLDTLGTLIDKMENVNYGDDIGWSKPPYNEVKTKAQYDRPYEWFVPDLAKQVMRTHSLQADLYWSKIKGREEKYSLARITCIRFIVILKCLISLVVYFVLIILGIFTAGFFWPKNL